MKTVSYWLLTVTLSCSLMSCSGSGNAGNNNATNNEEATELMEETSVEAEEKEVEVPNIKGYFLRNQKLYYYDSANEKPSVLSFAKKPVVNFWLSPKSEYIAFQEQQSKADCRIFSSIGVYDIANKKIVEEFAADQEETMTFFHGWKSNNKMLFSVDKESEDEGDDDMVDMSFEYTVGGDYERLDEVFPRYSDEEIPMIKSLNKDYTTRDDEDGVHLIKTPGEETIVSVDGDNILYYRVNAWLNDFVFLFSVDRIEGDGQCDPPLADLYVYDLNAGKSKLIIKNAVYFQLVK